MTTGGERRPLAEELAAARAAGAAAGLAAARPELLHLGHHSSFRLDPWPVVARVASGGSFDGSDAGLARELAVARHLAERGAPAVRPFAAAAAAAAADRPWQGAGCGVTLWALVEGRTAETAAEIRAAADALVLVHAALDDFAGSLPPLADKLEGCAAILADPARTPRLAAADRAFLAREVERLGRAIGVAGGRDRPLHGDAHLGNVLVGAAGAVWLDFESACRGPLEWDVASLPATAWPRFPAAEPRLLRLMGELRSLCVATWCWAEYERSAASAEAAAYHLALLRGRSA
ncbi:aminoglycoside phosphotransferase family protein [Sphingomonas ginkgonis]|uniref:Aminoglycoside phosphotransferase family protein n=1 Tax=Sphingomonas ginkgonis TaxID=2315330 RepID=A0A429V677_9SPHN|nr:aminoglycoside phosphotransferase family protein [Sphingomonas ginkgonis]RST29443.1 aminoglycoside phosphotransferase family protein [Sphingomonas ginkgonis]